MGLVLDADDIVEAGWADGPSVPQATPRWPRASWSLNSELNSARAKAVEDLRELPVRLGRPIMLTCNGAAWRQALLDAGGFDLSLGPGEDVD